MSSNSRRGGRADAHPQAVVGQDLERVDVVGRPRAAARERRHHRVHAAGVVADHAAERAVVVGRRIGTEGQAGPLGGVPEVVQNRARLDAADPARGDRSRARGSCTSTCRSRPPRCSTARRGSSRRRGRTRARRARGRAPSRPRRPRCRAGSRRRSAPGGSSSRRWRTARGCRRRIEPRRVPPAAGRRRGGPDRPARAGRCAALVVGCGVSSIRVVIPHPFTAYRSASRRFSSRPRPGRERSGRSAPPDGSVAPSNSSRSMRT